MVLRPRDRLLVEKIKPQRVLLSPDLFQYPFPQAGPFLLSNLTFEHGFLHARSVIFTRLSYAAQPAPASDLHSRDIISDQDEHDSNAELRMRHAAWAEDVTHFG